MQSTLFERIECHYHRVVETPQILQYLVAMHLSLLTLQYYNTVLFSN